MIDYLIACSHATQGVSVMPFWIEVDHSCLVLIEVPEGKDVPR